MIYIFGDSHGGTNFLGLTLEHKNCSINSVTMFRVGRDNEILNWDPSFNGPENIFIFNHGEVDCRSYSFSP